MHYHVLVSLHSFSKHSVRLLLLPHQAKEALCTMHAVKGHVQRSACCCFACMLHNSTTVQMCMHDIIDVDMTSMTAKHRQLEINCLGTVKFDCDKVSVEVSTDKCLQLQ